MWTWVVACMHYKKSKKVQVSYINHIHIFILRFFWIVDFEWLEWLYYILVLVSACHTWMLCV